MSTGAETQSGTVEGLPGSFRRGNMSRRGYRSTKMVPVTLKMPSSHPHVLNFGGIGYWIAKRAASSLQNPKNLLGKRLWAHPVRAGGKRRTSPLLSNQP